jgi:hypothetical protein
MAKTTHSRGASSRVWLNKTCSCQIGNGRWPTRAFTAQPESKSSKCSTKWSAPNCCRYRPACSRFLKKRRAVSTGTVTLRSNGLITRCPGVCRAAGLGALGVQIGPCFQPAPRTNRPACIGRTGQIYHRPTSPAFSVSARHSPQSGLPLGPGTADWQTDRDLGRSDDSTTRPHRHASVAWPAGPG